MHVIKIEWDERNATEPKRTLIKGPSPEVLAKLNKKYNKKKVNWSYLRSTTALIALTAIAAIGAAYLSFNFNEHAQKTSLEETQTPTPTKKPELVQKETTPEKTLVPEQTIPKPIIIPDAINETPVPVFTPAPVQAIAPIEIKKQATPAKEIASKKTISKKPVVKKHLAKAPAKKEEMEARKSVTPPAALQPKEVMTKAIAQPSPEETLPEENFSYKAGKWYKVGENGLKLETIVLAEDLASKELGKNIGFYKIRMQNGAWWVNFIDAQQRGLVNRTLGRISNLMPTDVFNLESINNIKNNCPEKRGGCNGADEASISGNPYNFEPTEHDKKLTKFVERAYRILKKKPKNLTLAQR